MPAADSVPVLRLVEPRLSDPLFGRLRRELPGAVRAPGRLDLPLTEHGPEELIALCLRCGVTARGSRIVQGGGSG
jgi:hypothetical protein